MKRLFFALCFLAVISNVNAQGNSPKYPFPAHDGIFPSQSRYHRQYQGENDYMAIDGIGWSQANPADPTQENVVIGLSNFTGDVLEATITIREMGIEKVVTLLPYSRTGYWLRRIEDYNSWNSLIESGVHVFVTVHQPDYNFNLGWFVYRPGVWNAPGGGYPAHKKDY